MGRELTNENTRLIFQMLTEMGKGNFSYKIPRTGKSDLLEAIYEQLNMTNQDLRENFKHFAFVNPHVGYQFITNSIIVLDHQEIIIACTSSVNNLKGTELGSIIGKPFNSFLTSGSLESWELAFKRFLHHPEKPVYATLEFLTNKNLTTPQDCYLKKLETGTDNCFTAVSFFHNLPLVGTSKELEKQDKLSRWDIMAIQQVHDHFMKNVGKPKLSNVELGRKFNINPHLLQKGFKALFGYTPFQYYNNLRLEEAKYRIIHTYETLEHIAYQLGFKSYPQFSSAFKTRFKNSPNSYRHNSTD